MINGGGHVNDLGKADGLADVYGFKLGEFLGVRLEQIRKLVDDAFAPVRRQVGPTAIVERRAGGRDGAIHVGIGRIDNA